MPALIAVNIATATRIGSIWGRLLEAPAVKKTREAISRATPIATALVIGSPKINRPANAALQSMVLWVMGTVNTKPLRVREI